MMSLTEMKAMFDQINKDCVEQGNEAVPFSDTSYYAEQIQNIFDDYQIHEEVAKMLAGELLILDEVKS